MLLQSQLLSSQSLTLSQIECVRPPTFPSLFLAFRMPLGRVPTFRIPRTGPLPGPETGFIATSFHSSLCRPHPASTATATATCQTIAGGNGANRRSAIAAPFFLSSGSHVAMNSKLVFRGRHSTACRSHVSAASRWGQSGS
jgi:hypothetical protein